MPLGLSTVHTIEIAKTAQAGVPVLPTLLHHVAEPARNLSGAGIEQTEIVSGGPL